MKTSRGLTLAAALMLVTGAWSQAQSSAAGATPSGQNSSSSYPKDFSWAVGEFGGEGEWTSRLPRLLIRGWDALPEHQLTDAEKSALVEKWKDDGLRSIELQKSTLTLALDKKRLAGSLASSEPAATLKSLGDLDAKAALVRAGQGAGDPPLTLPLRGVWATGQEQRPWPVFDRHDLVIKAKSLYAVTGTVRLVGGYLDVTVELFSDLENKVLAAWEGRFAAEEASDRMGEVSDKFHGVLLGHSWAGITVTSAISGTRIQMGGQWHLLPWRSDDLSPGRLDMVVQTPGRPNQSLNFSLEEGHRLSVVLPAETVPASRLILETDPPGVSLYLDSQYLGPSPQTIDRPLATTRVRAQAPGWATTTWEVGPKTASPSRKSLSLPKPLPSVSDAKDRFYFSLAAFSFSLTTSAFAGAWTGEQVELTNAYAVAGDQNGYQTAYSRYRLVSAGYLASVVLTSGLFVWMMFQLGDYLGAAQTNLP